MESGTQEKGLDECTDLTVYQCMVVVKAMNMDEITQGQGLTS